MGMLKKFNEYFYKSVSEEMDSDVEMEKDTELEGSDLEKLVNGEVNQVEIEGYVVSRPSELDGKYLIVKDGKHAQRSSEQEVLDIITGKAVFESRKHRKL
jgi:hypothetical protein